MMTPGGSHLFAGGCSVLFRPGRDAGIQLSADGGDTGDKRSRRPRHWLRYRRQPAAPLFTMAGGIVLLLLFSNLINLGADLGAMGTALKLLIHGLALLYVVLFG